MIQTNRVLVILGPTAVGKTELSLLLAQKMLTEIISGDSMLVYRGLNIGTAKPSPAEMSLVRHHMIDILSPRETFNVTAFCDKADKLIKKLNADDKIPIIAGGTGLYLKSLLEGYNFNAAPENPQLRAHLKELAEEKGREYVLSMLKRADPAAADRLHINNFRRIIRALEVYEYNKDTISQSRSDIDGMHYNALVIGLNRPRKELYDRINKRVDIMLKQGWCEEVDKLLKSGVKRSDQSMQAIGYKQLCSYLAGEISLTAAAEEIKKATRHFAKRQLTWYRKMPYIKWFAADKYTSGELCDRIYKLI